MSRQSSVWNRDHSRGLDERDQAFEWLEKAYEERDQGLSFLKVGPELGPLRSDARSRTSCAA